MENLGYGTQVIIDGYGADSATLPDHQLIRSLLEHAARQLEPEAEPVVVFAVPGSDADEGLSAGVTLSESQLALHVFPVGRCFSFSVFTRRDLPLADLLVELKNAFHYGRYESHLGNRARIYPRDEEAFKTALHGERHFVSARLDETLLTF